MEDGQAARQHVERGNHLLEVRRAEQAIEEFQRALGLDPENAHILCCIGRAFLMLGDNGRCIEFAGKAIAADPDEEWGFRLLAHGHMARHQGKRAYQAATRAVELAPESAACLSTLAQVAFDVNRLDEAELLGEALVRQFPESTAGFTTLGDIARRRGQRDAAKRYYEQALELDPEHDGVMEALAGLRSADNEYGDSVALLQGAVGADPNLRARQDGLRESMLRFALFGQAHQRRRSVAALVTGASGAYVLLGPILAWLLGDTDLFWELYAHGLLAALAIAIPLLRARFLKAQSGQLMNLYRSINKKRRRRLTLAAVATVLVSYVFVTMAYGEVGDAAVFLFPLRALTTAAWVYALAVAFQLGFLSLSDQWMRLVSGSSRRSRGAVVVMAALLVVTLASFAVTVAYRDPLATLVFFVATVISTIVFLKRFPLATALSGVAVGLLLTAFDLATRVAEAALTIGQVGLGIAYVSGAIAAWRAYLHIRRHQQRRRIGRLLAG